MTKAIVAFITPRSDSRDLRFYGFFLSLTHLATAWFWTTFHIGRESICWPLFSGCEAWQIWIEPYYPSVISFYGALAVLAAGFFLFAGWQTARLTFLAICVIKLVLHLSDYRMMGNYHYMTHIICFGFLILPEPRQMAKLWPVLLYFAAGLIKFNGDWLSGVAMLRTPIIHGKLLELAVAWAIILETVLVFFLLGRRGWLHWFVLAQVFAFHIFSWHIVGYFYPTTMLLMLTAFLIFSEPFRFPRSRINLIAIGLFAMAQLWPLIAEPDSSLNGRARMLSLNMLDARARCQTRLFLRYKTKTVEYAPSFASYGLRVRCDPALVVALAQRTCDEQKKNPDFVDIDLDHQVRRASDTSHFEQLSFRDVCVRSLKLGWLGDVSQAEGAHPR
jgi:hypothetical protein